MALFIGIHDMGSPMTDQVAQESWAAYKAACQKAGGNPRHTHYNAQQGRAFCLTEAQSADVVQKAHDEANVPLKEVIEVKELQ